MADDLSKLFAGIKKELKGAVRISRMGDIKTPYEDRLPFGLIGLDAALMGGLPRGTVNELFGVDGAGKNLLANMLAAQVQKRWGEAANILYLSFGYAADRNFMRKCGVVVPFSDDELERQGIDPKSATEGQRGASLGNLMSFGLSNVDLASDKPAEALLTSVVRVLESSKFQLIIIDEYASGETGDDVKKGLHEVARVATWANLVTQFSKKIYTALRMLTDDDGPNASLILVLQPVRAQLDAQKAKWDPFIIPSGHALKHQKAIDIHLSPAGGITIGQGETREKLGKHIKWKVGKGKFGLSEGAEGEFDFYFYQPDGTGGVDQTSALADAAKMWGTLERRGIKYYILDYDEGIEGVKEVKNSKGDIEVPKKTGLEAVTDRLKESPELFKELWDATLHAIQTGKMYGSE